ncbi:MAG TPA: heavy-metal-associated domain-containing protein [Candidatus Merdivicinus intestinavium]|nr:heavy-metal-associated domain-containing protein [Candidatus Merdivicinus intestinavium]
MFGLGKEETLTLHVEGMMCAHCAKRVSDGLKKEPGVSDAVVSLEEKSVTVTGKKLDEAHLKSVINALGYQA